MSNYFIAVSHCWTDSTPLYDRSGLLKVMKMRRVYYMIWCHVYAFGLIVMKVGIIVSLAFRHSWPFHAPWFITTQWWTALRNLFQTTLFWHACFYALVISEEGTREPTVPKEQPAADSLSRGRGGGKYYCREPRFLHSVPFPLTSCPFPSLYLFLFLSISNHCLTKHTTTTTAL